MKNPWISGGPSSIDPGFLCSLSHKMATKGRGFFCSLSETPRSSECWFCNAIHICIHDICIHDIYIYDIRMHTYTYIHIHIHIYIYIYTYTYTYTCIYTHATRSTYIICIYIYMYIPLHLIIVSSVYRWNPDLQTPAEASRLEGLCKTYGAPGHQWWLARRSVFLFFARKMGKLGLENGTDTLGYIYICIISGKQIWTHITYVMGYLICICIYIC